MNSSIQLLLLMRTSLIPRNFIQLRPFSQARPCLLKYLTELGIKTATLDKKNPISKRIDSISPELQQVLLPKQSTGKKLRMSEGSRMPSRKWTAIDDRLLYQLVKERATTYDIYANHFRDRSYGAVSTRVTQVLKAVKIQEQQAVNGVQEGEIDVAKSAAGEEGAPPLKAVYSKVARDSRAQQRMSNGSDLEIRRSELIRKDQPRRGRWSPAEDVLLRELVRENKDIPEPTIWSKISGGIVDGIPLLRTPRSCFRRWRRLNPSPFIETGPWSDEENLRIQKAIWEQFEGKYQVALDVLVGKPATTTHDLAAWNPSLVQIAGQEGLPILKQGSRRIRMLNWLLVQEKVGTRTEHECREHFYTMYHNGKRGHWTKEEVRQAKEGRRLFGEDRWKVAEYVGTRSPKQVSRLFSWWKVKVKGRVGDAEDSANEEEESKRILSGNNRSSKKKGRKNGSDQ